VSCCNEPHCRESAIYLIARAVKHSSVQAPVKREQVLIGKNINLRPAVFYCSHFGKYVIKKK
jgi:hypothetical protein